MSNARPEVFQHPDVGKYVKPADVCSKLISVLSPNLVGSSGVLGGGTVKL